ncbi:Methionine import ATP-binding protein MetN [Candidatus Hepatincola sp. Pdp]
MIEFFNVYKSFGSNEVLSNINFKINTGEIYGIIGYSGAGKSTLVRLINVLEKVTKGSLTVDGQDVTKLNKKELRLLRHKMGMIFQSFNLLSSRNVYGNIAFPLELIGIPKHEIKRRVLEAIKLVKLEGKEKSYPHMLSGGQKQRVGIARALVNNPNILLCDEITSALDPINTASILELIQNIQKERQLTVVLITHEMDVVQQICNKVAIMDKGQIVEQGDVSYVFSHPKEHITKKLILKSTDHSSIESNELVETLKGGVFLHLQYPEGSTYKALLSKLTLKFQVLFNVLEVRINRSHTVNMVLHLETSDEKLEAIAKEIRSHNIELDIIDNAG